MRKPDFMIIGGMKCATSTLHDQLAEQPGFFMSTPKEPNYFSDDVVFANGEDWYWGLFDQGVDAAFVGESSTHYTKFPTYPKTIDRIMEYGLGNSKFIYVIRHPIDRLVSHYIHEWSQGVISCDIDAAIKKHSELIDYSRYYFQIKHYLERFGAEQMLLVFFERLASDPQPELERICDFLGYSNKPAWNFDMERKNVSSERIRKFPLYNLLVESQVMASLRRTLVPRSLRDRVKQKLTMNERPVLSSNSLTSLQEIFDKDLDLLGKLIDCELSCESYKQNVLNKQASRFAAA